VWLGDSRVCPFSCMVPKFQPSTATGRLIDSRLAQSWPCEPPGSKSRALAKGMLVLSGFWEFTVFDTRMGRTTPNRVSNSFVVAREIVQETLLEQL
jgi:hypothetical protein